MLGWGGAVDISPSIGRCTRKRGSLLPAPLLGSLVFISFFVQTKYCHDLSFASQKDLAARVFTVYGVTLLVAAATLFVVGKLPLVSETMVAIKRTIIVAFPASFAATVVDSLGD